VHPSFLAAVEWREMCRFILYGCAEMPVTRLRKERDGATRKFERKHI
jgi:hypothetical protein